MQKMKTCNEIEGMKEDILKEVINSSKAITNALTFNVVYSMKVSETRERKTNKMLKDYRNKNWDNAFNKSKGDRKLALKHYMAV